MDIEQIAKQYTRQEFMQKLIDSDYGDLNAIVNNDDEGCLVFCPSEIKLKDIDGGDENSLCKGDDCKNCWLNAIKDIKFKDEIQENKSNNDKEYTASEIIHMIEEEQLNDNDMIITNEGVFYTIKVAKNSMISSLITLAPYKIKKYEPKINENIWYKRKVDNKTIWQLLPKEIFYRIGNNICFDIPIFVQKNKDISEYPDELKRAYFRYVNQNEESVYIIKEDCITDTDLKHMGYFHCNK